jgi:hypothetical protein
LAPHLDQSTRSPRLDGNELGTAAQLAPVDIKRMIGKEKLHVGPLNRTAKQFSRINQAHLRDNQARLKDKSSCGQSL